MLRLGIVELNILSAWQYSLQWQLWPVLSAVLPLTESVKWKASVEETGGLGSSCTLIQAYI
jgi:hypothetical protein